VAATEPDPAPSAPPPTDLASLRGEYDQGSLEASDLGADPLVAFQRWFDEVVAQAPSTPPVPEPNVMVLATVDADGRPAARAVLLKGIDERGLRFFTNRSSRKGAHLAANPACAATFVWKELERQVGITGSTVLLGDHGRRAGRDGNDLARRGPLRRERRQSARARRSRRRRDAQRRRARTLRDRRRAHDLR